MIDIRQSESYAKYQKSLGWTVERIGEINYFIKNIPIIGSVLKIQRPEEIRMDIIKKLCREYGVFQVIAEPKTEIDAKYLASTGFKLAKSTYLPSKTLQIDLTVSKDKIYAKFSKDCKYSIRRGEKIAINEYSTPEEIKIFRKGWKNSVKFTRYVPSVEQLIKLKKSFPQRRSLFLASHNISGRIIGGVIFTTSLHEKSNYITYYWQAFTSPEGRTTLSQYSLLWQGILWAKRNGYKIFDFEGVYDSRFPNKDWLGFSHFKRSFGGYEVTYPGCYTITKLFRKMTDNIAEYGSVRVAKWRDLPLLHRDDQGRLLSRLSPELNNLGMRIDGDIQNSKAEFDNQETDDTVLDIGIANSITVNEMLTATKEIVQKSMGGIIPNNKDLRTLAQYLDWSFQEQVGLPASSSTMKSAEKYGIGALDTWMLFTSIKNKLEK